MRASRYTERQIAAAIREAEQGTPAKKICAGLGISEQLFYAWKKRYAGVSEEDMTRLNELEDENRRLKAAVATLELDKRMLEDVLSKKT